MTRYSRHPPEGPSWRFWLGLALMAILVGLVIVAVRLADDGKGQRRAFVPAKADAGSIIRVWEEPEGRRLARIRHAVCDVFGSRCAPAWRIAGCETGGTYDPHALGSAGERGLFQIHPVHFGWLNERRLWEPRYNARIAWRLSRHGTDWGPWSCRP